MSAKERERLVEVADICKGRTTVTAASERLCISRRQMSRIVVRFKTAGVEGIIHKLRGRQSNHMIAESFRADVLAKYEDRYSGFGPTFASEKLEEEHGIYVKPATLRIWLMKARFWTRQRKRSSHHKHRLRKLHFGEMVQLDGSTHRWRGKEHPKTCFIDMVDDATSTCGGCMAPSETTWAAFMALKRWLKTYGIPYSLYIDGKFFNMRHPAPWEQRNGETPQTIFQKACARLGIRVILAGSAQAKGRVERKNGVLQDRLVKEIYLHNLNDCEQINEFLYDKGWLNRFNTRFAVQPLEKQDWHKPLNPDIDLDDILCWEFTRTVSNNWCVRWHNRRFQILEDASLPALPGRRITLRLRFDGVIKLFHHGTLLKYVEIVEPAFLKVHRISDLYKSIDPLEATR